MKNVPNTKTLVIVICNVAESANVRTRPLRFLTHANPKIGIASMEIRTPYLAAPFVPTLVPTKVKDTISAEKLSRLCSDLCNLPATINAELVFELQIKVWAKRFSKKTACLIPYAWGALPHCPTEGALNLKEVTHFHAATDIPSEFMHEPLALFNKGMLVISVDPNNKALEKFKS